MDRDHKITFSHSHFLTVTIDIHLVMVRAWTMTIRLHLVTIISLIMTIDTFSHG